MWMGSRRTDGSVNSHVCSGFPQSPEVKLFSILRHVSGLGHHKVSSAPTAVGGELAGVQVKQISTYGDCSLAVSADGQLYGWGNSEYLQLASVTEATQVSRDAGVQRVTATTLTTAAATTAATTTLRLPVFSADQLASTAPPGGLWKGGSGSVWRHSGGRPQRSVATYTVYARADSSTDSHRGAT